MMNHLKLVNYEGSAVGFHQLISVRHLLRGADNFLFVFVNALKSSLTVMRKYSRLLISGCKEKARNK